MGQRPPPFSGAGGVFRLRQGEKEGAPLTPDNPHFAQTGASPLAIHQAVVESPPVPSFADPSDAVTCIGISVRSVDAYVQSGIAPATRRAYRADLDHFEAWGGTIPATDDMVAAYIADHSTALKVATLTRRLAAISIAHGARGLPNPAVSPLVRATMRGIRRAHGAAQHQAKPLLREDLFVVVSAMGDGLRDLRDYQLGAAEADQFRAAFRMLIDRR